MTTRQGTSPSTSCTLCSRGWRMSPVVSKAYIAISLNFLANRILANQCFSFFLSFKTRTSILLLYDSLHRNCGHGKSDLPVRSSVTGYGDHMHLQCTALKGLNAMPASIFYRRKKVKTNCALCTEELLSLNTRSYSKIIDR
jgi:hypothetical protein